MQCSASALVPGIVGMLTGCTPQLGGLGGGVPLDDSGIEASDSTFEVAGDVVNPTDSTDTDSNVPGDADADVSDGPTYVRDGTYPKVKGLKGVAPNAGAVSNLVSSNSGRALIRISWDAWEHVKKPPPCAAGEFEHDSHCFVIDAAQDASIKTLTDGGVVVAAILYQTPDWARPATTPTCVAAAPVYCAPDDPGDFARFGGALAARYGDHVLAKDDHGRISDFFIGYEVNEQQTFGLGTPPAGTDLRTFWLSTYDAMFTAAFNAIVAETGEVHIAPLLSSDLRDDVLISPAHLSPWTLLDSLESAGGARQWRVAIHPQGIDPNFSASDATTKLTFGNIGAFDGELHARYGTSAHSTATLVDVNFDSSAPRFDAATGTYAQVAQMNGMCRSMRQALSTPGFESWLYYELDDVPSEATAYGLYLGLRDAIDAPKTSWGKFASMDQPSTQDCGFEFLPYVVLTRRSDGTHHWASTRMAAPTFGPDGSTPGAFLLLHDAAAGTHGLFECEDATSMHFVSLDPACEGATAMGTLGQAWSSSTSGAVELLRCDKAGGGDSIVTTNPGCEGYTFIRSLGWVLPKT